MEWPVIELEQGDQITEEFVADLTSSTITKEIYARAANAAVADITVDHKKSGLQAKVDAFLNKLRKTCADDNWQTEYRNIARDFTELIAFGSANQSDNRAAVEICQGGLDAVHDLLKYRLPESRRDNNKSPTVLPAKDAYILSQSFPKLETMKLMGTRAPDIDFRFGLLTKPPTKNSDVDDTNSLFGIDACHYITEMRNNGQLETSAASLAKHTFTNPNLVAQLDSSRKIFVVLGCDHPLSPTKSLLRIPGVTVLGIASNWQGLNDVVEYAQHNSPDDTTFIYPTVNKQDGVDDGNLVLSRGPHVAQWILDNIKLLSRAKASGGDNSNNELVLVPMPAPPLSTSSSSALCNESDVRWAAASDLIIHRVLRARSSSNYVKCSLWSYQSSTTCMVVPPPCTTRSTELLRNRPSHEPWLHTLSRGTILTPTIEEDHLNIDRDSSEVAVNTNTAVTTTTANKINHDYSIVNGILTAEGPHHVLAEHIRMWRCMVTAYSHELQEDTYSDDDDDYYEEVEVLRNNEVYVFAPHIPLLTTTSGRGFDQDTNTLLLEHLRVFDTGMASSVMAAISLAGLVDPIVNRPMPVIEMGDETTPFAMFWNGSVHGGIWNYPYTLNSVHGPVVGYVLGKVYEYYDAYSNAGTSTTTTSTSTTTTTSATETSTSTAGGQAGGGASTSNNRDNSGKSVVDIVPSTMELVQERLEFLA